MPSMINIHEVCKHTIATAAHRAGSSPRVPPRSGQAPTLCLQQEAYGINVPLMTKHADLTRCIHDALSNTS